MKQTTPIPQHNLLNAAGRPVAVDYEEWGTVAGYNVQHAHRHNFHEILFFRSGAGAHDIDFTTWKVQPGAVHFVASENVHMLMRDKDTMGCSLMFTQDVFPADLLARLPFSQARPVLHLDAAQVAMTEAMLVIICGQIAEGTTEGQQVARAQMQALLLYLASISLAGSAGAQSGLPPQVTAFRQLLPVYYKQHLGVEGYAGLLHISAKHLIDLCKKNTGKTPLQHIREYVAAEAKRLLYNTELSVKQVAYELGFDDPANFSKYFKSVCGYSPADYRREGK